MSFLACGFEAVNNQGPDWMPRVSFEPPPVKMSSVLELTLSVMNADARAPEMAEFEASGPSANTWSQSWDVVVEPVVPRTPVVTLASSSKVPSRLGLVRSSSCSRRIERRRARFRSGAWASFPAGRPRDVWRFSVDRFIVRSMVQVPSREWRAHDRVAPRPARADSAPRGGGAANAGPFGVLRQRLRAPGHGRGPRHHNRVAGIRRRDGSKWAIPPWRVQAAH